MIFWRRCNHPLPLQVGMASKINKYAKFDAGSFQIIEQLRFFTFGEIINSFNFNDQFVIDKKISNILFFSEEHLYSK